MPIRDAGFWLFVVVAGLAAGCQRPEALQRLPYFVFDAEYSASLGLVASVAFRGAELHVYDPVLRTDATVPLAAPARSVGVSPDGAFAAVGEEHLISYVDLANRSVVATYPVSFDVSDIVAAGNGYVYAVPQTGNDIRISTIDLATGAVTTSGYPGMSTHPVLRLQPDRNFLYATDDNTVYKFDIGTGRAENLYSTPSVGTAGISYASSRPCDRLWPANDGGRVFTGCGNTFRAADARSEDLAYRGSFEHTGGILDLAQAADSGRILVLSTNAKNDSASQLGELQLYGEQFLDYRGSMQLPPFVEAGARHPSSGRFVFYDATRHSFVVILGAFPAVPTINGSAVYAAVLDPSRFAEPVPPPPPPQQSFLTFEQPVVDAEYSSALDRIVYVTGEPTTLHALDPETGDDRVVPLPLAATSVSVGPDGLRAAVGHDGWMSLVDLERGALIDVYPISTPVTDAVLAGNGWMYGVGSTLRGIELSSGREVVAGSRYYSYITFSGRIRLHPGGTSIYSLEQVIPARLGRFSIAGGPPSFASYYPYFGEHEPCYELWLSEDGERIFTECTEVFRALPGAPNDMTVEGALGWSPGFGQVADSAETGTIAVIANDGNEGSGTRVETFSSDLLHSGTLQLPNYVIDGTEYPAYGTFLFFNAAGTRLHVIVRAYPTSGFEAAEGVVSLDAN